MCNGNSNSTFLRREAKYDKEAFNTHFRHCAHFLRAAFNDAAGFDGDETPASKESDNFDSSNTSKVKYFDKRFQTSSASSSLIKKGDTVFMDIAVQNATGSTKGGVAARLTSASPYITFLGSSALSSKRCGNIESGCYKTFYYTTYSQSNPASLQYCTSATYAPFSFSVSEDCPNTLITILVDITDEAGERWSDSFTIKIESTGGEGTGGNTHNDGEDGSSHEDDGGDKGDGDTHSDGTGDGTHSEGDQTEHSTHAPLEYYEYKVLDSSSYGMANNDGVINKGERIYLGFCIHNTTDKAISGVRATLKTQSPY